jgi:signal transduction histidine kinase
VLVYLTNPSALYQRQQAREFWFGGLITASALASMVGLFAAWRASRRQERLAELKTNFVSSVSHELRSPIASVRLMAESLENGKVDGAAKQREYFHFIGLECRRLSSLIENILDFSRIEQGRKQYEFEPTDIVSLVKQTVTTMRTYAEERGVKIEFDSASNGTSAALELVVDGRAIQQALVNLFDNAIKHSAPGQVVSCSVGLRPSTGTDTRQAVCITISDQGPGIPEGEHEKIFERFYRLGSELRRETQGVGIGLSIVKHIVEAHGGKVMVESKPGNGSRFVIKLPPALTNTNQ